LNARELTGQDIEAQAGSIGNDAARSARWTLNGDISQKQLRLVSAACPILSTVGHKGDLRQNQGAAIDPRCAQDGRLSPYSLSNDDSVCVLDAESGIAAAARSYQKEWLSCLYSFA
jgi:hypothetical protein